MTTTLITGADKGLGLETTRRLIDVTDPGSVAEAVARLPELDLLVNNAGVVGGSSSIDDLDADAVAATLSREHEPTERGRFRGLSGGYRAAS